MGTAAGRFVVATFNVHAGIDGWGRAFDVRAACRAIDADVLVLQEAWAPESGPSMAEAVAEDLGCSLDWYPMARGRRGRPHPGAAESWMRPGDFRSESNSIFLDSERPIPPRVSRSPRFLEADPGAWGLAVLSRLPVERRRTIELGRLRRDRVRRVALLHDIDLGGRVVTVVGTHMSHLTSGSPLQFRRLHAELAATLGNGPAVLAGDMNLWGPPAVALLRGWRRAVRTRTWPAWRPHSQLDHILVRGPVSVLDAVALPDFGSDHLALRAHLEVG
jgi:endonuclease/exonuclease/phosphatase family metal-dependent hydrolase